jgi:AraC-like DNA-binding protein
LGVLDPANIAKAHPTPARYPSRTPDARGALHMTAVSSHERSDLRQRPGVYAARFEGAGRPWCGMKTRFTFIVTERGNSEFFYRGQTHVRTPGHIQILEPGEMSLDVRSEDSSRGHVVLLDEVPTPPDAVLTTPVLSIDDLRARPLLALHQNVWSADSTLAADTLIAEAALAIARLTTSWRDIPVRERVAVRRARAYLLERMTENVRLDDVADHVRLDKYHLIRAFRAHTGVPPYEFLTHARIARAQELLAAGRSATEVAAMVGYCDQSQLHRHFVRIVGVTPGRFAAAVT